MKSFAIVTVLIYFIVAAECADDDTARSSYGGGSASGPGYGGNAATATAPASISFHSGGLNNGAAVLKVESVGGGAAAPAVISIPGGGFASSAVVSALPCPKNYLISCQPSLQTAPCSHAIGGYGSVGAYSENHPVYAAYVPQYVERYRRN